MSNKNIGFILQFRIIVFKDNKKIMAIYRELGKFRKKITSSVTRLDKLAILASVLIIWALFTGFLWGAKIATESPELLWFLW